MLSRRIGMFHVMMDDDDSDKDFYKVLNALKFIPYKVEYLYSRGLFQYEGFSPLFDEILVGDAIPYYDVIATTDKNKNVTVEVINKDNKKDKE